MPPTEPSVRGVHFIALRRAITDLFGEAGLEVAGRHLPEDVRQDTLEVLSITSSWFPERYAVAWFDALLKGPAAGDHALYFRAVDRMLDHGFGVVRRALLNLVSIEGLLQRVSGVWRSDHTTGELSLVSLEPASALLALRDHPYLESPHAQATVAETVRYCASLVRVREVEMRHEMKDGALEMRLRWTR